MKTYIKVALFVVTFIALSLILAALYYYNLKQTDMSKAKPDYVLTSTFLMKAFEENEKIASTKYISKILEVTGVVSVVETANENTINVSLISGSNISAVICTFPALIDQSVFRPGEEITLRGECSGYLLDVLLNNCAIIK